VTAWLQGVGIGFAIAAPVGPIGLLCIRRTLHHGRGIGLATGLGAATADTMYGVAVAAGLAITGWLTAHAAPLAAAGALLLAWMGWGALRAGMSARAPAAGHAAMPAAAPGAVAASTTDAAVAGPDRGTFSPWAAFAGTLALTLANPATIVSFVAVVAALGPQASSSTAAFQLVAGVFVGSMAWWLILVSVVHRLRRALSAGWMRAIDLVTAAVLLATAAWIGLRLATGAITAAA
jgi:threonine/homoserine/homoserine lactone efflux protein